MFEENVLELYFVAGVLFISEVETLDVNTTGRPQTDTISGIFVLDYYIYIYIFQRIILFLYINTVCFDILMFNYIFSLYQLKIIF